MAINDLVTLVDIALGNAQLSACPQGIPSGTAVGITLIIQAVNNALGQCPGLPKLTRYDRKLWIVETVTPEAYPPA